MNALSGPSSAFYISNRDNLPRLCLNIENGIGFGFFNIKIIFNDYLKTAQSSLIKDTKYELKLYNCVFKEKHTFYKSYGLKDLFQVSSNLIVSQNAIDVNQMIEIKNLKQGKYLIEVI